MPVRGLLFCLATLALLAGCGTPMSGPPSMPASRSLAGISPPAPRVGDNAVYAVRNGYNSEPVGDVQYLVEKVEGDRAFVAVTTTSPYVGSPYTQIESAFGNWMRHALNNHNQKIVYDFSPPYPAYPFPLDAGKNWSLRVNATSPQAGKRASVRVDGEILGYERITVPAGSFDVVTIRRRIYAGDWDAFLHETNIVEIDWYSPELGRSVRFDTNSHWLDTSRGAGDLGMFGFRSNQLIRGDWHVYELVNYQIGGKRPGATIPPPPPR
jgi:hypothetical protein